jgi:lysophospholipase L1-like esterase
MAAVTAVFFGVLFWAMSWPEYYHFQIAAYEQADRAHFPQAGGIVFTGSSSFRLWSTLSQDMRPLPVINRAFGGSQIAEVTHYARQIITPYHPRAVVLYAGDNDLSFGWKSPDRVLADFKAFVATVHADLPQTWIYYVSMKPARFGDWPLMDRTNRMIAAYIRTQERVQFVDVSTAMLDQGRLRHGLYGWDPMHMNAQGYALWTSIIRPVLMERFGPG